MTQNGPYNKMQKQSFAMASKYRDEQRQGTHVVLKLY